IDEMEQPDARMDQFRPILEDVGQRGTEDATPLAGLTRFAVPFERPPPVVLGCDVPRTVDAPLGPVISVILLGLGVAVLAPGAHLRTPDPRVEGVVRPL